MMPRKYYLVTTSFPGCLAEDGFVSTTLKGAAEGIRRVIDDYRDGWEYIWEDGNRIKNENFAVEEFYHTKNKNLITGATIRYAEYGGGINVEMNQVDARTAKQWMEEAL